MQPNGTYYYPPQSVPAQFASGPYPPQLYPAPPPPAGFANYAQAQGSPIPHPPYAYPPYPQAFVSAPQPYSSRPFGSFYQNFPAPPPDSTNSLPSSTNQPRPSYYPPSAHFRSNPQLPSGSNSPQTPIESTSAPSPVPVSSKLHSREDSPLCSEQVNDLSRIKLGSFPNMSAAEYTDAMRDLGTMTVERLKRTITRFNESFTCHLRMNGLKNDLYTRVRDELNRIYTYERNKFPAARLIISQVRQGYASSTSSSGSNYGGTATATATASGGYGATTSGYGASTSGYNPPSASYNAAIARAPVVPPNGLPPPRFGASTSAHLGGGAAVAAANRWQNDDVPIKFRPSPFYRVEKSLSPPVTLYKAEPGDRKSGHTNFGLTEAQRGLISKARESPNNPQYEVRLYCTSDNNYSIGRPHASQFPAPIEFPQTCEIKLNGVTVNANTKGIKKQPGTTPPVNLSSKKGPAVQIGPGQLNKVEVIYTNTEKITYYMVAYLIETTPINKVVEKVKAGRTISKEEVIQSIKDLNSDEEIAAGPLGLSLRDPLSFARIGVPVRSKQCKHISCFDAETWFEMNEQTPTWNCPICSKTLKFEEMVVDGYFEDILKMCPNAVEAVTVNPDGTWRSDDNKHGTGPPRASKTSTSNSTRNSPHPEREESTKPDINGKGKAKAEPEALLLDSDSDDEPLAKRPRIGGYGGNGGGTSSGSPFVGGAGSNGVRNGRGASEVLDLTLDDSDEDDAPRPAVTRPSIGMARTSSGGGEKKTIAEVQRDIDAMNKRMREEYGENWRTKFGMEKD